MDGRRDGRNARAVHAGATHGAAQRTGTRGVRGTRLPQHFLRDVYALVDSLHIVQAGNVHFDRGQLRLKNKGRSRLLVLGMLPLVLALMPPKIRRMIHFPSLPHFSHAFYQRHIRGDAAMRTMYESSLKQFVHNANYIWDMDMSHPPPSETPVVMPSKIAIRSSSSGPVPPPAVNKPPSRSTSTPAHPAPSRDMAQPATHPFAAYQLEIQRIDQALASQNAVVNILQDSMMRSRQTIEQLLGYRNQLVRTVSFAAAAPFPQAPPGEVVIIDDAPAQKSLKRARPSGPDGDVRPSPSKRAQTFTFSHLTTQV